jgi:hypothetical protein
LAQKLSMTVADMSERMSHAEYVLWTRFYARKAQQQELQHKMAGGR